MLYLYAQNNPTVDCKQGFDTSDCEKKEILSRPLKSCTDLS